MICLQKEMVDLSLSLSHTHTHTVVLFVSVSYASVDEVHSNNGLDPIDMLPKVSNSSFSISEPSLVHTY